jgi:hypothetical protein
MEDGCPPVLEQAIMTIHALAFKAADHIAEVARHGNS